METTWILGVGVWTTSTGQLSTTACQAPKTKAIAWHWDMTPGSCMSLTHNSVMWEVTGGPHSPDTTPHGYGGLGGGRGQIQNQENFPLGLWSFDPTRKQYGELFNNLDSTEDLFHKNFLETYRNFVKHFSWDLFSLIFLWAYGFHAANIMDGVARILPFEMPDCLDVEFKEFFLSSY